MIQNDYYINLIVSFPIGTTKWLFFETDIPFNQNPLYMLYISGMYKVWQIFSFPLVGLLSAMLP